MNLTERHAQRDESAGIVVDARRLTDLRRVHTRRLPIYRPIPGARGCGRPGASGLLCLRKAPRRQRSSSDGPVAETAHSCRSSYFEEVASAATTKTAIAVPSTAALPEEPSGGTARRAMNGSRSSNSDRVTVPVLRCCMTARVQNVRRIQPDACLTYLFAQPFVRRIVVHPTVPLLSVRRSRCESPDRSRGEAGRRALLDSDHESPSKFSRSINRPCTHNAARNRYAPRPTDRCEHVKAQPG